MESVYFIGPFLYDKWILGTMPGTRLCKFINEFKSVNMQNNHQHNTRRFVLRIETDANHIIYI